MQSLLIPFGWCFMVVMILMVIVPYLRGRRDLLTSWNLFLIGSANFVGFAAVQSGGLSPFDQYGEYDDGDYVRLIVGAVVFYVFASIAYYRFKTPQKMGERWFQKWPPLTNGALALVLPLAAVVALGKVVFPNIHGVAQTMFTGAPAGAILMLVLTFVMWYRNPANPVAFWGFLFSFPYAITMVIVGGTSRRELIAALLAVPLCVYWLKLRYASPMRTFAQLGVGAAVVFVIVAGYSTIRHRNKEARFDLAFAIESLQMLPTRVLNLEGTDSMLGGDSIEASLLAIKRYRVDADPEPFFTLRFIAVAPMPRYYWPDKPESLGTTLPRDTGHWATGYVNWGPGIVGHGYHEGGLYILVIYGLLFGCVFRFFDTLLVRQSDNPYVLGGLTAVAGHTLAFSRGDIGVFSIYIIGALGTVWLLGLFARLVLGTGVDYRLAGTVEGHHDGEQPLDDPRATWPDPV